MLDAEIRRRRKNSLTLDNFLCVPEFPLLLFLIVNVSQAVFRFRKWIFLGDLNRLVNFAVDALLDVFDIRWRSDPTLCKESFEPSDGIFLFPEFEQFRWNITGIIMGRMSGHAEGFALDQCRAISGARSFNRPIRDIPHSKNVISVDNLTW